MYNTQTVNHTDGSDASLGFLDFCNAMAEYVKSILPEDAQVEVREICKNNDIQKMALSVQKPGVNTAPQIRMSTFYKWYQNGKTFKDLAELILEEYNNARDFDTSIVNDYGKARELFAFKLINRKRNQQLLRDAPYLPFLDLAIVPILNLSDAPGESATAQISNGFLKNWGIDKEQLLKDVLKQMVQNYPAKLTPMSEFLAGMGCYGNYDEEEVPMYVLASQIARFGAAVMVYPGVLQECAKKFGGGFYILPSSVSELLLVLEREEEDALELLDMVRGINEDMLKPEEVLSNMIYKYNPDAGTISLLDVEDHNGKKTEVVRGVLCVEDSSRLLASEYADAEEHPE